MSTSLDLEPILRRWKRPLCLAIAGGSGAGKTTLARALLAVAGEAAALLVSSDAYYRDRSEVPEEDRESLNFDHPDALDFARLRLDLLRLRRGLRVQAPVYDFRGHRRRPVTRELRPRPLIVIDGVLLLADAELRSVFDLAVYLDAPAPLRLARRVERDQRERGRSRASVLRQVERSVAPMHARFVEPSRRHADVVLDGSAGAPPLPALLHHLRGVPSSG